MLEEINLSDRYVVLLDESLQENRSLRQQLQERDAENTRRLTELSEKVDTLCQSIEEREASASSGRSKKTSSSKVNVPKQCRNEFRAMYKLLLKEDENFEGFNMQEGVGSSKNKETVARVVRSVYEDNGGDDKCPWSSAQLKVASITYFKTLKDSRRRHHKRPSVDHNTVCRRQGRKREKLNRRLWSLRQLNWQDGVKEKCRKGLTPEYTSSDESSLSEDEQGNETKAFVVKKLPWESRKLSEVKATLDQFHKKSIPTHVRNFQTRRFTAKEPSTRSRPEDPVKWAVNEVSVSTPLATSTPAHASRRGAAHTNVSRRGMLGLHPASPL